jgi:hypothetical protein
MVILSIKSIQNLETMTIDLHEWIWIHIISETEKTSYLLSIISTSCHIYNIRTLPVNIKFICTSFRNRQNSEPLASFSSLFRSEYKWIIFNDNVRILCLSCNVKKVGKLVGFKQKGQKQASFLAFHKCCQGCLILGPRYISTSFIIVCALGCT